MFDGNYPRVIVAGLSGDSGKTVISCGLLKCFRGRGLSVSAFKKGPDYIDPAWLSLASGKPARNLDTYLMGFAPAKDSFLKYAGKDDVSVIEGNRGLFDGVDSSGTHSTAELAKLLQVPVIIVLNISKLTRTAAATVLGCVKFDPEVKIAGVILNHAANERHACVVKDAIEATTGVPVFGAIPRLSGKSILPSRHLGLIMPGEFQRSLCFLQEAKNVVEDNVDVAGIVEVAEKALPVEYGPSPVNDRTIREHGGEGNGLRIAYFKDESFSFYYPENLEMLEAAGAELIPISPSRGKLSGDMDALYIGGGFPEMNLTDLILNREMIAGVRESAENGLPIYAECGGLMYLARSIEWNGKEYSMSGVLPIKVSMDDRPQGHGYCEASVDRDNPFFRVGTAIKGHEFHYSKIADQDTGIETALSLSLSRGVGCFDKRDGLTYKNVFASYMHIHATSSPEWVNGMIKCASKYRASKKAANLALV
ncbi:MAG: cobyrinate a,c-diamide synthase [Bacteroidetes bacterium]|nr:cobyrinate a,c-diamide synthase [Bacteroidota bacterium]